MAPSSSLPAAMISPIARLTGLWFGFSLGRSFESGWSFEDFSQLSFELLPRRNGPVDLLYPLGSIVLDREPREQMSQFDAKSSSPLDLRVRLCSRAPSFGAITSPEGTEWQTVKMSSKMTPPAQINTFVCLFHNMDTPAH